MGAPKESAQAKHKRLARELVKNDFNKKRAYEKVYPKASPKTVDSQAYAILKKYPEILEEAKSIMVKALNDQGLHIPHLNEKLADIINDPTKEVATKTGNVISLKDKNLQLSALRQAYELHGKTNASQSPTTNNIQVNINTDTSEKLDATLKSLDAMSKKLGISEDAQDGEIIDVESSPID